LKDCLPVGCVYSIVIAISTERFTDNTYWATVFEVIIH